MGRKIGTNRAATVTTHYRGVAGQCARHDACPSVADADPQSAAEAAETEQPVNNWLYPHILALRALVDDDTNFATGCLHPTRRLLILCTATPTYHGISFDSAGLLQRSFVV